MTRRAPAPYDHGLRQTIEVIAVIVESAFLPPLWMRNPHVQSLLVSLPFRRRKVELFAGPLLTASKERLIDCGEGVRLQAFFSRPADLGLPSLGKTAVLLHGWEGNSNTLYILSLAQKLFARGFDVVRLNLRDHGGTHHLNRELFHSCLLPEVIGATRQIQSMLPGQLLHLAGFSLGGNFALRVAAQADAARLKIAKVIAISPELDPGETLRAVERGFSFYHRYFMRKWASSLLRKQAAWPSVYDFAGMLRLPNLRQMTQEMVRRFTPFGSLEEYLVGYSITGDKLASLTVPARVITAYDDPIVPVSGLQRLPRLPSLSVTVTRHGGHCGFFDQLAGPVWLESRLVEELAAGSDLARDAKNAAAH
jgi:predicted alpha/beta-fold hydrolase